MCRLENKSNYLFLEREREGGREGGREGEGRRERERESKQGVCL